MATRRTVKPVCKVEEVFFLIDGYDGDNEVYEGPTAREDLRMSLNDSELTEYKLECTRITKITYDVTKGLVAKDLEIEQVGIKFSDE